MHIVEYDIFKNCCSYNNNSSLSTIKFSQKIFELLETNIIIISKSKKFVRFFDDYKNFVESFIFIDIITLYLIISVLVLI